MIPHLGIGEGACGGWAGKGGGKTRSHVSVIIYFLSPLFTALCKRPRETDRCWQHLGPCYQGSKWLWAATGEKKLLVLGRIMKS